MPGLSFHSFTSRHSVKTAAVAVAALALVGGFRLAVASSARAVPPPAIDESADSESEIAVLAGGCFWGVQGVYQHVMGVKNAVSGYAGGERNTAEYERVGTGRTGHAESVQITFDPHTVTYGRLLQIYFSVVHDPTELNRQGPDTGTQYRSTIFPMTAEQARIAKAYIEQLGAAHTFGRPIVTTVEPGRAFYPAEEYHQNFLAHNPENPYIFINDLPKIEALKRVFPERYRAKAVLVNAYM